MKFEYLTVTTDKERWVKHVFGNNIIKIKLEEDGINIEDKTLDFLGNLGYELVTVIKLEPSRSNDWKYSYYFKKEIK